MPRRIEFSGGTPHGQEALREIKKAEGVARRERIEGEREKTQEQLEIIDTADKLVAREFARLGLEQPEQIDPQRVHFFDQRSYEAYRKAKKGPDFEARGWADLDERAVYTSVENELLEDHLRAKADDIEYAAVQAAVEQPGYDKLSESERNARITMIAVNYVERVRALELLNVTLHEALHMASFEKYYLTQDSKERGWRSGYQMSLDGIGKFQSLNEAITEKIANELMAEHIEPTPGDLDPREDLAQFEAYEADQTVLNFVIDRIASQKGESSTIVWQRFKANYLTGGIMHFRDIERALGKGALRFYAKLTPYDLEEPELVRRYFETTDPASRKAIETELFGAPGDNKVA